MRDCAHCKKSFLAIRANQRFCGSGCQQSSWRESVAIQKRLKAPKYVLDCLRCGVEIRTNDSRKKFCSSECNWAFQNSRRQTTQHEVRTCPTCGKRFKPLQARGVGRTYCTDECRDATSSVEPRAYAFRSKSVRENKWGGNWWKALRRDNFTCQMCRKKILPMQWKRGGSNRLMVHHLDGTGDHENKNHGLWNLVTVCFTCHSLFHRISLVQADGKWFVSSRLFRLLGLKNVEIAS